MGWIRELFTGGENERGSAERYPGPRDRDYWGDEPRESGRGAGEWRAARDAWHAGATRSWSEAPRRDPGGTFSRSPASHQSGWYGVRQTQDVAGDVSRGIWGTEGGGGWYQGDFSRERGSGERRYGPYEDVKPTSYNWHTGFSEGYTQADPAEPAFNYGVGSVFQPMRSPYGGANWTPESMGGYALGESIYGRSVIRPDAKERRRGRVAKGWRRADQRIREDVSDRLTDDPDVDASEIEVEVLNAVVTLRGTVGDRRTKYLAEDLAEEVFGVEEVHNELRVTRGASLERRVLTAGEGYRGPR
jgi:hypothetical protein